MELKSERAISPFPKVLRSFLSIMLLDVVLQAVGYAGVGWPVVFGDVTRINIKIRLHLLGEFNRL